jgi:hypothetical protein
MVSSYFDKWSQTSTASPYGGTTDFVVNTTTAEMFGSKQVIATVARPNFH